MTLLRSHRLLNLAWLAIIAFAVCRLALFHGVVTAHGNEHMAGTETIAHAAACCTLSTAMADMANWHDVVMIAPQALPDTASMVLFIAVVLFAVGVRSVSLGIAVYARRISRWRGSPKLFDATQELFRRGILHPKTF